MKKLLFFFGALVFVFGQIIPFGKIYFCNVNKTKIIEVESADAANETTTYAKASTGCTLYKSSSMEETFSNIYFIVPETYFMSVLQVVSDTIMMVNYNGYVGYIYSSNVIIATFIPILKTLDGITFNIKDTSGTQVWSEPSSSSTVLTTIPAGTKKINYVAYSYGDIPSGGESNIWYYVTYTPKTNETSVYEGYVYSENTTELTEIVANAETNPEVISSAENDDLEILISPTIKTLLVALISVPIIIFISVILFKFAKMMRNFKQKRSNFAENKNANNFENEFLVEPVENNITLKNQINSLKQGSFVRKKTIPINKPKNYPVFPSYDSDDDLL